MNQYSTSFDYVNMFQVSPISFPIKAEEPFMECEFEEREDREDAFSQAPLSFMKPAHTLFYNQVPYEHMHPLFWNQRRRSPDITEPLDLDTSVSCITPPETVDFQPRAYRSKPQRGRTDSRRFSCEDYYPAVPEQREQENSSELPNGKSKKIYNCEMCGKTFKFQTSLLRHNNKMHISKYQCQTCQRRFSRQAYLDVHTSKQGSSCFLASRASKTVRSNEVHYPSLAAIQQSRDD